MKISEIKNELESDFIECFDNVSSESWTNFFNKCYKRAVEIPQVLQEPSIKKKKTVINSIKSSTRSKIK